jgi:predicted RNase H-like HicB family nuclease
MNSSKLKFKTIYGVLLEYVVEIVDEFDLTGENLIGTYVTIELPEVQGVIVQANAMSEAFDMLDEMLDVFLELEIGLELTALGFKFDKLNQYFYYENK